MRGTVDDLLQQSPGCVFLNCTVRDCRAVKGSPDVAFLKDNSRFEIEMTVQLTKFL